MYKSDIEIAQSVKMLPIGEIAEKAGIDDRFIEPYGRYKAKVDYNFLNETKGKDGKLILVTAINPTPAGEGKTTTTIGLADGLKRGGRRLRSGRAHGGHKSALYGRLPCHRRRKQSACGDD